jgi:hypothetical protein
MKKTRNREIILNTGDDMLADIDENAKTPEVFKSLNTVESPKSVMDEYWNQYVKD